MGRAPRQQMCCRCAQCQQAVVVPGLHLWHVVSCARHGVSCSPSCRQYMHADVSLAAGSTIRRLMSAHGMHAWLAVVHTKCNPPILARVDVSSQCVLCCRAV